MSDVRCRACGAVVPGGAQWCSLCFADLRTPAVVREPVSVSAGIHDRDLDDPQAAAVAALQPPTAAPAAAAVVADAVPAVDHLVAAEAAPTVDGEVTAGDDAAEPVEDEATWPCPRCAADVAISLDACDTCGAGFLAGAAGQVSTRLPLVGDMTKMSSAQRLGVGIGISVALMIVVVVLAALGGLFL